MSQDNKSAEIVMEHFRALRTEIIEAQKLRVQVGLAKIVFLGTLLGFFLKNPDRNVDIAILICPFVALMFDCMVYGLSFNIRDIGEYIRDHLEKQAMQDCFPPDALQLWQTFRTERKKRGGYIDWGRGMFRTGSYGLSILVAGVSFHQVIRASTPSKAPLVPTSWLTFLILILGSGWGTLILLEFFREPIGKLVQALSKRLALKFKFFATWSKRYNNHGPR